MVRIRHDIAWATTLRILEIFNLRDEEQREAFPMVYERIKDGLLAYEKETKDLLHRLRPLNN
jgi:cell fate regulator YaaT (PSP1 superfamily)